MSQSLIIRKTTGNSLTVVRNGATASGSYTLLPATVGTLGGIIVGDNLTITANGVLSGVNSYTLPAATNSTLGGVIVGSGLEVDANGSVSVSGNSVENLSQYGNLTITDASIFPSTIQSELRHGATGTRVVDYALSNAVRNDSIAPKTANSSSAYATSVATSAGGTSLTRLNYETYPSNGTYTQILLTDTDAKLSINRVGTATALTKVWSNDSILTQGYADGRYIQTANFTYANLTGTPTLSAVATSGAYSDLSGTPDLSVYLTTSTASSTYQPLGNYTTSADLTWSNITGKPTFATVATSGSYNDLTNLPTLFDGSYTSLTNIPATFTPSAHNHTVSQITDFPSLATVATSGSYADLIGTPDLSVYIPKTSLTGTVYEAFTSRGNGYLLADANATDGLLIGSIEYTGYASYRGTIASESSAFKVVGLIDTIPQINWSDASGTLALQVSGTDVLIESTVSRVWESRSVLTRGYADTRYATTTSNTFTGTQSLGGNIIDKPQLQAVRETKAAPSIASNVLTLDLNAANFFAVSLNAAITTLTISNVPTGVVASFVLEFTADGTARAVAWPASFRFPSGTTPELTTASGKKDVFVVYTADDGTTFDIVISGQNL